MEVLGNLQIGSGCTVASDLQVNGYLSCFGSPGGNIETKQIVVKNTQSSVAVWRITPSASNEQLDFFCNTPMSQTNPFQIRADIAGVRINGNLEVTGSINNTIRASNVAYSKTAEVDSTVQETIAIMQNDIGLIESGIAALPTTYQTIRPF